MTYILPSRTDVDGDTITLTQTSNSPFVSFSAFVYTMSPTIAQLGPYTVSFTLSDGINAAVPFSFTINVVVNTPPTFSTALAD